MKVYILVLFFLFSLISCTLEEDPDDTSFRITISDATHGSVPKPSTSDGRIPVTFHIGKQSIHYNSLLSNEVQISYTTDGSDPKTSPTRTSFYVEPVGDYALGFLSLKSFAEIHVRAVLFDRTAGISEPYSELTDVRLTPTSLHLRSQKKIIKGGSYFYTQDESQHSSDDEFTTEIAEAGTLECSARENNSDTFAYINLGIYRGDTRLGGIRSEYVSSQNISEVVEVGDRISVYSDAGDKFHTISFDYSVRLTCELK